MPQEYPVDAIASAVAALLLPELRKLVSPRPLLNEDEAEEQYGLGRGTFRHWRNRSPELAPPVVKIGRRYKYRPDDMTTWMQRGDRT